jgi:NIMA (never in mitosis gene a)-related kinase
MEYMDGGDLEQRIASRGTSHFPEKEILFIFVQVVLAISHLHERHILHRDLKPQNVFLTSNGIVKLGDFGVAKSLSSTTDLARTLCGTPYYFAPELWNSAPYSWAADIYSLGAILYEMCALRKPYEGANTMELCMRVMKGRHGAIPSMYSSELRQLVDGMLSQDPRFRPTARQICGLPLLSRATRELIDANKGEIAQKPKGKKEKRKHRRRGGRSKIPVWARGKKKPGTPSFGHEEEFEDDFISDDEDELAQLTSKLEDAVAQPAADVPKWRFVKNELEGDVRPPVFLTSREDGSALALRLQLQDRLGDDLVELYENIQNEDDPQCARYIEAYAAKNHNAVVDVRHLIDLENVF